MWENLFLYLYPLVGVATVFGYMPQIIALIRSNTPQDGLALSSWVLWVVTQTITVGYGVFQLNDWMFIVSSTASLVMMLAVVVLVVYNRHIRFACQPAKG